jgi:hypothetical protein
MRNSSIMFDGAAQLTAVLAQAGYPSVVAAVAKHTVFLHPDTVGQAGGSALFPVIRARNMSERGAIEEVDGHRVMLDDNTAPTHAFLFAAGVQRGEYVDVQFNHVWSASRDPNAYTALWNLCVTPAFLAKTTDGSAHPEVIAALRYRSFELYGSLPLGQQTPMPPGGHDQLRWAPSPEPVDDLAAVIRARLARSPKSRTARACREIGWLFSSWQPDRLI